VTLEAFAPLAKWVTLWIVNLKYVLFAMVVRPAMLRIHLNALLALPLKFWIRKPLIALMLSVQLIIVSDATQMESANSV
jgi:hypothetical protein